MKSANWKPPSHCALNGLGLLCLGMCYWSFTIFLRALTRAQLQRSAACTQHAHTPSRDAPDPAHTKYTTATEETAVIPPSPPAPKPQGMEKDMHI